MKYVNYSAEDFANDSFFIRWVKNPDEQSQWFWKSFMLEHPALVDKIERARRMILEIDFPGPSLSDEELARMRTKLLMKLKAEREEENETGKRSFPIFSATRPWMKAAAAVPIVAAVGIASYFLATAPAERIASQENVVNAPLELRANPAGQKSVLFLDDGTKVWLNAASRISYAQNFNDRDSRDVYLEGEAFFDVVHDRKRPFVVHTSSIQIKVLGTAFNVKSYSEERTIETTLVRGKVQIEQSEQNGNSSGAVELRPNQRAVFDKTSRVFNVKDVVAANSGLWRQETLVFDEASFDNVILEMERWYNVKIHVENRGNLTCKLTANIEEESLEDVLKLIEATHNVTYIVSGRDVFIEGLLCH